MEHVNPIGMRLLVISMMVVVVMVVVVLLLLGAGHVEWMVAEPCQEDLVLLNGSHVGLEVGKLAKLDKVVEQLREEEVLEGLLHQNQPFIVQAFGCQHRGHIGRLRFCPGKPLFVVFIVSLASSQVLGMCQWLVGGPWQENLVPLLLSS